jgi:hypothetical protein
MSTRKPTSSFTNTQITSSRLNAVLAAGVAAGRCTENRNDQTTKQQVFKQDLSNGYKQLPDTLSTSTLLSTLQTSVRDLKKRLRDKRREYEVIMSPPVSWETRQKAYAISQEIDDLQVQIKMMVVDRRRKLMQQEPLSSSDAILLPPSINSLEDKILTLKRNNTLNELNSEIQELEQQISTAKSTPLASLGTFQELELKLQKKVKELATHLKSNVSEQDELRMEIVKLQHQIWIARSMPLLPFGTIIGHEEMISTREKLLAKLNDEQSRKRMVEEIAQLKEELATQKGMPLPAIESINKLQQKITDKSMEMSRLKDLPFNSKTNDDVKKAKELYEEIDMLQGYVELLRSYRYHGGKLDEERLRMWKGGSGAE